MSENVTFLFMYHSVRNCRWVFVKVRTLGFDGFQTPLPPPLPPIRAYGFFTNDPKKPLIFDPLQPPQVAEYGRTNGHIGDPQKQN